MITIAPFEPRYAEDLFRISLATGHMGGEASHLYKDPKLMGLIYSAPYATLSPSTVLLALDDKGVAGFALGVTDTVNWEDRLEREWWPRLRPKYPDAGDIPAAERTADQRRHYMIHHPPRTPPGVAGPFPAHMHLNLLPRAQGAGNGPRLLEAWMEMVAPHYPAGVHVAVNRQNERALTFWTRSGFRQLEAISAQSSRTIWLGLTLGQR